MEKLSISPRIALCGSVNSTRLTLKALVRHRANMVGVLGLSPRISDNVSGYTRLDDIALTAGIPYAEFENINHPDIVKIVQGWQPDILFVVGLSQLIKSELISIPRVGSVGFHPTWLPEGRGRAPVAWLVLDSRPGAATFFQINEDVDAGPIFVQEPFFTSDQDYAVDVIDKLEIAIDKALNKWLPSLVKGEWVHQTQSDDLATFFGRRSPEDGLIDWSLSATEIYSLVRATSRPHPGAYTFVNDLKVIVWSAELEKNMKYKGVVGRILYRDAQKGYLIQTGKGLLWIKNLEYIKKGKMVSSQLRTGMKLGYSVQDEIYHINQRIVIIEKKLKI